MVSTSKPFISSKCCFCQQNFMFSSSQIGTPSQSNCNSVCSSVGTNSVLLLHSVLEEKKGSSLQKGKFIMYYKRIYPYSTTICFSWGRILEVFLDLKVLITYLLASSYISISWRSFYLLTESKGEIPLKTSFKTLYNTTTKKNTRSFHEPLMGEIWELINGHTPSTWFIRQHHWGLTVSSAKM